MTFRATDRGRIVVGLVVLLIAATIGCQVVFPLRESEQHNSLRCDCRCDGAGSRAAAVVASSDDAVEGVAAVVLTGRDLVLGEQIVGLRFDGVMLPPRAVIQSAYVQFTAAAGNTVGTDVTIFAEASTAAATFTTAAGDISGRPVIPGGVQWLPPAWSINDGAGLAQRTPELSSLLQQLVELPGWTDASPVVLRIEGSGRRTAEAFDGGASAPVLVVTYDATVEATLPICASADVVRDSSGRLTSASLISECGRVEETMEGLGGACGYPTSCSCEVHDVPDHSDSGQSAVCAEPCVETPVDATCSNFDPNGFAECLAETASVAECKSLVAATNAPGDSPVCVNSGSPFAFHLFGRRSQCDVDGASEIHVGDREPKHDPETAGLVEILGGPCPGGGCSVHPFFDLHMAPITFDVKFHSDPTFEDLKATGRALEAATTDATGVTFFENAIEGTGVGRRGATPGLAVTTQNGSPLDLGIDWTARTCAVSGNLATAVDGEAPEGLCAGDGATVCAADSPDCDGAGGPCVFEATDSEEMTIDVTLLGTLVNQPPTAMAGADQVVECTSPAGASFTLDGRGSTDPDHDLALARWRRGGRTGAEISDDLVTVASLAVGATETYSLLVIDSHAQTGLDEATAAVVDTTPPDVFCNSPATITPPAHDVTFVATATDVCTAGPIVPQILGYECFKLNGAGKRIDKTNSCKVTVDGPSITIRPPQGVGNHIAWTVRGTDAAGNSRDVGCEVVVANPGHS